MADDEQQQRVLSRVGFAAHGAYYLLLALLTVLLMTGGGASSDASAQGALASVARQPFGKVVLVAVAAGFLAYAWRRGREVVVGDDLQERAVGAVRGVVWVALAALAIRTVVDAGGSSSGSSSTEASITATVLGWPAGPWLVGLVGAIVVGIGIGHGVRAFSGGLADELQVLDLDERRMARTLGGAGHLGRAFAFGLVGGFVIRASVRHDPSSGNGLDGALQQALDTPYGPWAVGLVAIGFAAFGCFRLVESRYRFPEEDADGS